MDVVFFIGWILIGLFVPAIVNHFKPKLIHSVRFIALYLTIYLIGIDVMFWMATKEDYMLWVLVPISLWGGLQMLLLPKTAPGLAKKFDLKW